MVKLTKIYTRGGDKGETSLVGGKRVAKHDLRVEVFGTIDETNAAIGAACIHVSNELGPLLGRIQNDLFDLGADLANPEAESKNQLRILPEQVKRLETEIDELNANLSELESFILPGGSPAAAHLHLSRTVCRRAERLATALAAQEPINPEAMRYLNRLSDLLFVAARVENSRGKADLLWQPGGTRT